MCVCVCVYVCVCVCVWKYSLEKPSSLKNCDKQTKMHPIEKHSESKFLRHLPTYKKVLSKVEDYDPKVPFLLATTPGHRERRYFKNTEDYHNIFQVYNRIIIKQEES